jgi:hypothetical protein
MTRGLGCWSLLSIVLFSGAALAGDCYERPACGRSYRERCQGGYGWRGGYGRCTEGAHLARFHGRGGSWTLLRRYIHRDHGIYVHTHPRFCVLDRWPLAEPGTCSGPDTPAERCAVATGARGEARVEGVEALLARATERLHQGLTAGAEADFGAALVADPTDLCAEYGLLLVEVMDKRWEVAAERLRDLARRRALHAGDRLVVASVSADEGRFEAHLQGLALWTAWHFHEVDAQLVAAWGFAATGREAEARAHLRSVLRFAPGDVAAERLLATFGEEAPDVLPEPVPPRPRSSEPVRPAARADRDVALEPSAG